MLGGEDLRGGQQDGPPPLSTTVAMANRATIVLPAPTSPCSSRCIGCPRQIGPDLVHRRALAVGEGERQSVLHRGQQSVGATGARLWQDCRQPPPCAWPGSSAGTNASS